MSVHPWVYRWRLASKRASNRPNLLKIDGDITQSILNHFTCLRACFNRTVKGYTQNTKNPWVTRAIHYLCAGARPCENLFTFKLFSPMRVLRNCACARLCGMYTVSESTESCGAGVQYSSVRTCGKPFPFKSVSRAQQNRSIGRNRSISPKRENPGYDGVADRVWTDRVPTDRVWTDWVWTDRMWTDRMWTDRMWTDQVWTDRMWTNQAWVLTDRVLTHWPTECWPTECWLTQRAPTECGPTEHPSRASRLCQRIPQKAHKCTQMPPLCYNDL